MIATKGREIKRGRMNKMSKNIERIYKEGKCRECSVVVTRMDFAKILGKFTKVKVQYETSTSPKTKQSTLSSPTSNSRLKNNENGMVLIHRKSYTQHPVKELLNTKKANNKSDGRLTKPNILKENNRLKKTPVVKDKNSIYNDKLVSSSRKKYGIVFVNPNTTSNIEYKHKVSLSEILPEINESVLPTEEWCIEYLPNEPKNDKVYDRIAAELEDLMYNEKHVTDASSKTESTDKVDDFPSIMDILNDNTENKKDNYQENAHIESSDVEAMLLGKPDVKPTPMEVDNTDVSKLIDDVAQLDNVTDNKDVIGAAIMPEIDIDTENPQSPSILDEALKKGIEEHLPFVDAPVKDDPENQSKENNDTDTKTEILSSDQKSENEATVKIEKKVPSLKNVTHVVFKKTLDGNCCKIVTCPKTLKYNIELEGKTVEFLGAPKYVSSLDDLKVLLEIVDNSELSSLYVFH